MARTKAVLLDRDGTLIANLPHNCDPARLQPMPRAREALDRLRAAGYRLGVVTNQPGLAEGWIDACTVAAVHARVEALVGRVDAWFVCAHGINERCACRKPQPGLILQAAATFGVCPCECVVVGDIASDVEAAHRAGARALLVPTSETRPEEIDEAPIVAPDLLAAAKLITGDC